MVHVPKIWTVIELILGISASSVLNMTKDCQDALEVCGGNERDHSTYCYVNLNRAQVTV